MKKESRLVCPPLMDRRRFVKTAAIGSVAISTASHV